MKLIFLLLPLTFLAKADMDYVCYVDENNFINITNSLQKIAKEIMS